MPDTKLSPSPEHIEERPSGARLHDTARRHQIGRVHEEERRRGREQDVSSQADADLTAPRPVVFRQLEFVVDVSAQTVRALLERLRHGGERGPAFGGQGEGARFVVLETVEDECVCGAGLGLIRWGFGSGGDGRGEKIEG